MRSTAAQKGNEQAACLPNGRLRSLPHGASLGLKTRDTSELIQQLERGLSFHSLEKLERLSGLAIPAIAQALGIPLRTLARRKTSGRLTPGESERLLRISSVFEKAVDLFEGDIPGAANWLMTPKRALGGQIPFQYSRTEPGAREIENLIGRLEHGVFS